MSPINSEHNSAQGASEELPVRRPLSVEEVRERLAAHGGPRYWRSLEELADSEAFRQLVSEEFPSEAHRWLDPISRRQFLQIMAASLALAGLSACAQRPREAIVPYGSQMPEQLAEAAPLFFATAFELGGYFQPILAESHMGRPTKIEGNPDHPASLGAASVFAQASVLDLYDPDRSQVIQKQGSIRAWGEFLQEIRSFVETQRASRGSGIRILTRATSSPTLTHEIRKFLDEFPEAKWIAFEAVNRDAVYAGTRLAFGQPLEPVYRFADADIVAAFDCDFMFAEPGALRYACDFAARRNVFENPRGLNRFYAAEPMPSCTATLADHRLPVTAARVGILVRGLAKLIGLPVEVPALQPAEQRWLEALAEDLKDHRGAGLVVAGQQQPAEVHALAHAINHALDNLGKTVAYMPPVLSSPSNHYEQLEQLAKDADAGKVQLLIVLDANPVAEAPAELKLAERFEKIAMRVHCGTHFDETAEACVWHVPAAHYLESWGDGRAYDGTLSLRQPLIAPLYGGKPTLELVAALRGALGQTAYDLVRTYWRENSGAADFEAWWRSALHDGFVRDSAPAPQSVHLALDYKSLPAPKESSGIEVVLRPDPSIYDGRFANNGWLQELPKPITKLTWDNAVHLSPGLAQRLGLRDEDEVAVEFNGHKVVGGAVIVPGHADESVTVHFGYGRRMAGRVGNGLGFSVAHLQSVSAPWQCSGAKVQRTGRRYPLARTQMHFNMENRHLVRTATLAEYEKDPNFVAHVAHEPPPASLYPPHKYDGYPWGMAVNLAACIGCNACVVACQAENNIPVVGKDQVLRGREMHWLRIDQYFEGSPDNPAIHNQPVNCMQCENAPCEPVCPVQATVHDDEGLNAMVYNRCLGTRYCANNCPYKVRRFNFLEYQDWKTPSLKLVRNPDVTVRQRGVMEKCTYCVQRISHARITANNEGREIRDGEVLTACQATCPTNAIVFGNINDPNSQVARLKALPLNYGLLTELNTRPRTTYLGSVRNPNPKLMDQETPEKA